MSTRTSTTTTAQLPLHIKQPRTGREQYSNSSCATANCILKYCFRTVPSDRQGKKATVRATAAAAAAAAKHLYSALADCVPAAISSFDVECDAVIIITFPLSLSLSFSLWITTTTTIICSSLSRMTTAGAAEKSKKPKNECEQSTICPRHLHLSLLALSLFFPLPLSPSLNVNRQPVLCLSYIHFSSFFSLHTFLASAVLSSCLSIHFCLS